MKEIILSNEFLAEIVKVSPMIESEKAKFWEDIPYMNEEQRIALLELVKDLCAIEEEKAKTIRLIKAMKE